MQPLGADEPTAVGPYRLLGRLGSGGMGRVYLGRSAGGRTVAVKIVHPHLALDEEFRARFRREVEAARRVGGAWTAPVLDADPEAAVPWVATAYAAGPSLAAAVSSGAGPLPEHTVRVLGAGLAEALAAVHGLGLVHRDVKPSNVLLTVDGPLLIDFGIARAIDGTASLTSTGVSIGSPGYMAPEQILGHGVTGASDVFSLGAVLAYAATGEPPFPGDSSAALLYKVVHEEPVLGASVAGELRELVEACLAKDPTARPAPDELARRLAPEGAARLVAGGWLPGALVAQVGRSAVQLLNLEAAEAREVPSGPVGFSSPSVGEAPGVFGPPPVMVAETPAPANAPTGPTPAYTPAGPVPVPRDAVPGPATPADGARRPGKVSVTMAAGAAPGEGGRGRRLSCSVVLAVAGALAVATLGSTFLFRLLPDGDDDRSAGSDARSAAPSTGSSTAGAGPTALPARYVGTWEGQGSGLGGTLPMGTFRVTLKPADVGDKMGQLRQTDVLGGVCVDVLTLKKVTKKEVVATSVGAASNHAGCNPEPHTIRFTPTGDDLTYRSDSAAEGNPTARMSKAGS
ncbi:serine/threonine-protein kinase [Streptomyces phaeofaciens JCM 4814]|uniref:Serine/threonine protein kinase n=1 Tax=Streptomyces phaeofaciens TaxID=68254 RepID=A0A918LVS6_9ACTN|nr:serine/threonine-protein kinase [Streptomyces phaeofaciens]GGT56968.1 serine/threonine protein kinase [Streptomyces phaeofaciens]